jgi:hypothetical protein
LSRRWDREAAWDLLAAIATKLIARLRMTDPRDTASVHLQQRDRLEAIRFALSCGIASAMVAANMMMTCHLLEHVRRH